MSDPIRVLIVDDHSIVREGLRLLLEEEERIEVIGEASNGAEAVSMAADMRPAVILMDLVMPQMDGIEATKNIAEVSPESNVLILTSFSEDRRVPDAIQAGATGYLLKDVLKPDLLRAIEAASRGEPTLHPEAQRALMRRVSAPKEPDLLSGLTKREMDVLKLIANGRSNKEIAGSLLLT